MVVPDYPPDPEWHAAFAAALTAEAAKDLTPNAPLHDIATRRKNAAITMQKIFQFPPLPAGAVVTTAEHTIPTYDGQTVRVLEFTPAKAAAAANQPGAAIVYTHGGGMVALSADLYVPVTRALAHATGLPVFSVDQRCAPEHPHPAPTEDVYAAVVWLQRQAATPGAPLHGRIDPARIAIAGDSGGGGIAAGVALMARDRQLAPPLARQVLLYPMLDHRTHAFPRPEMEAGALWAPADNMTAWTAVLGHDQSTAEGRAAADAVPGLQYASPARAASLAGLPRTYIDTGSLDLFAGEIDTFAARLRAENPGVPTDYQVFPGLPHAFDAFGQDTPAVKAALAKRLAAYEGL